MHTHTPRWLFVSTLVLLICPAAFAQTGEIALLAPVQVVVDMDPARPGIQSNVNVLPADVIELKVSVYVFHPSGTARIWSIGYFGGLDRGIAFGHVPTNTSRGGVRKIEGALGTPVHPDGHGWIANAPFLDPLFAGPEIQYLELPATESPEAASISTGPFRAVFHAGIQIGGAQSGDVYHFFLGDRVAAWMPDQGSFSAAGLMTLDTGGDSIPDRTATLFGTDADRPVPVPPGAYFVDFVDGDGGATVTVLDCSDLTNVSVPACDGVCGGLEGIGCPDGEFCRTAPGECCCDFFGECQPIPDLCIALYDPVCGCDGRTYSNACEAATAGVAVDHRGACEKICGGPDGIACDDGEFCRRPEGVCALDRSFGVCESFPPGCPDHVDPVCGCDGVNYGNPCEAAAVGMSIAHRGECLEVCGGFAGFPCPEGQFCKTAPGECCCDFFGKCTEFSESCKDVFDPVCGCDGRTYKNPCEADRVGVSVDHRGTCEKICGGLLGLRCEEGQFCLFRDGQCNVADNTGVCEIFPPNCTEEYAPVCGCDNKTYDNRCFARAAGVSVDHVGPCGQECGGPLTVVCPDGEFCMFREGACGPSDGTGECRTIPPVCTDEWDPVCGCDSKTYGNACEAAAAGVSISHRGACGEVCGGLAGIACTDGEFCKLPDGECCCDIQGECMTIPNECPAIIEPVCGCDHRTYVNECVASSKGVSIKHRGHCRFFDAVVLFDCWSGPGVPASPECLDYDLDGDGDVDLTDFGQYLRKYSGG